MKVIRGKLAVKNKKIAIIVARFNKSITENLLNGAVECIVRHGGTEENITIIHVPGSFELPSTAMKVMKMNIVDAIICLGAVIKGETDHYNFVAGNASSGISSVGVQGSCPVIFGVLTVDTLEQAFNRSGMKQGNAGYDAALSAIDMMSVYAQIDALKG